MTRAEPSSINDIVLQGGPLLLPLVLSTSAALYRGAMKAKKAESAGFEALGRAFGFLPPGIWAGIGLVWAYWTASQAGVF